MNTGTCRSCNAAILWVNMEKTGKANPLDPKPAPDGNVFVGADGTGRVMTKEERDANPEVALHLSHFATCPGAANHRKK